MNGLWTLRRGDFQAEWDVRERHGWIRQTLNPYAIDSVLRVVHSLVVGSGSGRDLLALRKGGIPGRGR